MTDRDKFEEWHKKHGVNTLGSTCGSERESLVWQACSEQYRARIEILEARVLELQNSTTYSSTGESGWE
jgi:hypothetical protein